MRFRLGSGVWQRLAAIDDRTQSGLSDLAVRCLSGVGPVHVFAALRNSEGAPFDAPAGLLINKFHHGALNLREVHRVDILTAGNRRILSVKRSGKLYVHTGTIVVDDINAVVICAGVGDRDCFALQGRRRECRFLDVHLPRAHEWGRIGARCKAECQSRIVPPVSKASTVMPSI